MELVVTLRKEVEDSLEGKHIFEQLKARLADVEGIKYNSHVIERDLENVE